MIDRVLIFGDSITWGADDQEGLGWANRLRKYLQATDENIAVYNCGIRGDTTENLLEIFSVEANARRSRKNDELIIFAIGINDSRTLNGQQQVELSKFKANVQALIEQAKVLTSNIIFVGLTRVVDGKSNWTDDRGNLVYTASTVKEYDTALKTLVNENSVNYVEMFDLLEDSDMPDDGLHPDARGHEKMFNRIKDYITANNFLT
jgi:lysophospholipase L1-like esterase